MRKQRRKKNTLQIQILASICLKKEKQKKYKSNKVNNDLNLEFKFNLRKSITI